MKYFINYPEDKGIKFNQFRYPAGEEQVRIKAEEIEKIAVSDEIIVTARISSSSDILGLMLLTDAIGYNSKRTLILPYLPYSRADRRFVEGDCHGLKTFGQLIDSLAYDKVVTLDVHSKAARQYISNLFVVDPIGLIKIFS